MNIGFLGLLQLIFIVLKLTNVVLWSWVLVFTPIYISIAIFSFILLFGMFIAIKKRNR